MFLNRLDLLVFLAVVVLYSCGNNAQNEGVKGNTSKAALISLDQNTEKVDPVKTNQKSWIDKYPTFNWKYNLLSADYSCNMPASLVEISALGFIDDETMIAVNDEKANLYFLDRNSCEVKQKVDFGKNGDYEGVEFVNGLIYVLKGNGNVYPYDLAAKKSLPPIKSALKAVNDVEGLGYDSKTKMLVLACKGSPYLVDYSKTKDTKAFYGLDLVSQTLNEEPLWLIKDAQLLEFYENDLLDSNNSRKATKKLRGRLISFSPSAIARHPFEGSFYVLSSVGKLLVVCTDKGIIQHIEFLDDSMFRQPEGIAFTSNGAMYISNEGKSFIGKIQGFDYKG